jgi:hypothetical protein
LWYEFIVPRGKWCILIYHPIKFDKNV